jgi:hypothetical protein
MQLCVGWFLGDNDQREVLHDPATGGCHDGLTTAGRSANQGAESTIALLTTLQHGRSAL